VQVKVVSSSSEQQVQYQLVLELLSTPTEKDISVVLHNQVLIKVAMVVKLSVELVEVVEQLEDQVIVVPVVEVQDTVLATVVLDTVVVEVDLLSDLLVQDHLVLEDQELEDQVT
jgi:hypothetical protein